MGNIWTGQTGGSGGKSAFKDLTDTPEEFGDAGQIPAVNADEDGLVYTDLPVFSEDGLSANIQPDPVLLSHEAKNLAVRLKPNAKVRLRFEVGHGNLVSDGDAFPEEIFTTPPYGMSRDRDLTYDTQQSGEAGTQTNSNNVEAVMIRVSTPVAAGAVSTIQVVSGTGLILGNAALLGINLIEIRYEVAAKGIDGRDGRDGRDGIDANEYEITSDDTISGEGTTASPLTVANPFTDEDEVKLDGIEAEAEVNVGVEFTPEEKVKLANIASGATAGGTPGPAGPAGEQEFFFLAVNDTCNTKVKSGIYARFASSWNGSDNPFGVGNFLIYVRNEGTLVQQVAISFREPLIFYVRQKIGENLLAIDTAWDRRNNLDSLEAANIENELKLLAQERTPAKDVAADITLRFATIGGGAQQYWTAQHTEEPLVQANWYPQGYSQSSLRSRVVFYVNETQLGDFVPVKVRVQDRAGAVIEDTYVKTGAETNRFYTFTTIQADWVGAHATTRTFNFIDADGNFYWKQHKTEETKAVELTRELIREWLGETVPKIPPNREKLFLGNTGEDAGWRGYGDITDAFAIDELPDPNVDNDLRRGSIRYLTHGEEGKGVYRVVDNPNVPLNGISMIIGKGTLGNGPFGANIDPALGGGVFGAFQRNINNSVLTYDWFYNPVDGATPANVSDYSLRIKETTIVNEAGNLPANIYISTSGAHTANYDLVRAAARDIVFNGYQYRGYQVNGTFAAGIENLNDDDIGDAYLVQFFSDEARTKPINLDKALIWKYEGISRLAVPKFPVYPVGGEPDVSNFETGQAIYSGASVKVAVPETVQKTPNVNRVILATVGNRFGLPGTPGVHGHGIDNYEHFIGRIDAPLAAGSETHRYFRFWLKEQEIPLPRELFVQFPLWGASAGTFFQTTITRQNDGAIDIGGDEYVLYTSIAYSHINDDSAANGTTDTEFRFFASWTSANNNAPFAIKPATRVTAPARFSSAQGWGENLLPKPITSTQDTADQTLTRDIRTAKQIAVETKSSSISEPFYTLYLSVRLANSRSDLHNASFAIYGRPLHTTLEWCVLASDGVSVSLRANQNTSTNSGMYGFYAVF